MLPRSAVFASLERREPSATSGRVRRSANCGNSKVSANSDSSTMAAMRP